MGILFFQRFIRIDGWHTRMIGDEFVKLNMSERRVLTRRLAINQNPISAQGASLKNLEVTACSSNRNRRAQVLANPQQAYTRPLIDTAAGRKWGSRISGRWRAGPAATP
jgi:hypothetical protein